MKFLLLCKYPMFQDILYLIRIISKTVTGFFGMLLIQFFYFQKTNTNVIKEMNSFKGNVSFFKGWLNFSSLKVLELLPAKARRECFEIL